MLAFLQHAVAEKTSCGSRFDANELGKLACLLLSSLGDVALAGTSILKLDNDFQTRNQGSTFFCLVIGYGGAQHGRELLLFP